LRFGFLRRVVGWRFGLSVIGGVAASARTASSNDNGASEIGCDLAAVVGSMCGFLDMSLMCHSSDLREEFIDCLVRHSGLSQNAPSGVLVMQVYSTESHPLC
jgi:hypothetical protein